MANQLKQAWVAGSKTRVQNTTAEQTIKATAGILWTVIAANSGTAATLAIADGATTQIVLQVPANDMVVVPFGVEFDTSIKATPSATTVDALFIYD